MELREIIDACKLNRTFLAQQIGMDKGTFNNKLRATHPSKFTADEEKKLREVLATIHTQLDGVNDPFNDALKTIVRKEVGG
jgi:hypothetical protein